MFSAAKRYQVLESALRDRSQGYVTLHAKNGHGILFTVEEEKTLFDHISYTADIGYGYQQSRSSTWRGTLLQFWGKI